jgi:hypothetical protein
MRDPISERYVKLERGLRRGGKTLTGLGASSSKAGDIRLPLGIAQEKLTEVFVGGGWSKARI